MHITSIFESGCTSDIKCKMRLPFPRKAENRKDVKDVIVEMTRAAADAEETAEKTEEETAAKEE